VSIRQKDEIRRRIAVLRKGRPLPDVQGKTVVLVDDGIAVSSTMRASILFCKNQGARKIVVGAPVSSEEVKAAIGELVDEIVVLETPTGFRAVAQAYLEWHDVSDEEAMAAIEAWERGKQRTVGTHGNPAG
jgi:putative phosphoribosyl transferase